MTARDVFERAHAFVREYDIRFVDCFTDDGVLRLPFAPPPMPRRVQGREALRALYAPRYEAARAAGRRIAGYKSLVVHETKAPDVVVAEFEVEGIEVAGTTYALSFVQVMRVEGNRIAELTDYFDSLVMEKRLQALRAQ